MADKETENTTVDPLAVDASVQRTTGSAGYGVTKNGFFPKPFVRLLSEKLALAKELFGQDLDLTSGSAIRKLLEISALEDARTWAALESMYENSFIVSATGDALSRLGEEKGIRRPYNRAAGKIKLILEGTLPAGHSPLVLPKGSRLSSPGGHHVALDETVSLSEDNPEREVKVEAFYPGPSHNLDPTAGTGSVFSQKLDRWNKQQDKLAALIAAEKAAAEIEKTITVRIEHTQKLSGGELFWPDLRYRELLLRAPQSIWSVESIETAVSLVPGVRRVQVRDHWGGLDINQSIFGNFNFIERLFGSERDIASPYYFTVLAAPTVSAIWNGPDGLRASIESALEDLRPIGIFPKVEEAREIGVGIRGNLVIKGIPLPSGNRQTVNGSAAAKALKARILTRVERYVNGLDFGEPVRFSEVMWSIMNEPGVQDIKDLQLLIYPESVEGIDYSQAYTGNAIEILACGSNAEVQTDQIPVFVDDDTHLTII